MKNDNLLPSAKYVYGQETRIPYVEMAMQLKMP